ncbi:MAG: hypothetical protein JRH20_30885, partial [Deltaproteobacteria bacterium]|nr:hypothetical protein [Deltaproteobacteria bacterium]
MGTLDPYLDHLEQIDGITIHEVRTTAKDALGSNVDATITLRTKLGLHHLLVLEYRSHLTHQTADPIVAQALREPNQDLLLLAPSIGAPLGAKLAQSGINYLDRNGNCHIALSTLHIHIEGRRARARPSTSKGLRSAGYQVLFCFLAQPELINAPLRSVAAAAGVSRQPASDTKRRLLDEEYLVKTKNTLRWVPRRQQDALGLWLHGYETMVRPSLLRETYRTADASPIDLERRIISTFPEMGISEFRWGGCAAGFRLAEYYRGERTVVHVHTTPSELQSRLSILSDPRGNLVLMTAFGEINWQPTQTTEGDQCNEEQTVHPLL